MFKNQLMLRAAKLCCGPGEIVSCYIPERGEQVDVTILAMVHRNMGSSVRIPLYVGVTKNSTIIVASLNPTLQDTADLISLAVVPYQPNKPERRQQYRGTGTLYGSRQEAIQVAMTQVQSRLSIQDTPTDPM